MPTTCDGMGGTRWGLPPNQTIYVWLMRHIYHRQVTKLTCTCLLPKESKNEIHFGGETGGEIFNYTLYKAHPLGCMGFHFSKSSNWSPVMSCGLTLASN